MSTDLSAVLGGLWAVEETRFRAAFAVLSRVDFAAHVAEWEKAQAARGGDTPDGPDAGYAVNGGVAVVPISGPMTKKPHSMQSLFGGTSTVLARRAIRQAVADPSVSSILLHVDSPGGQVDGTADLADEIYRADQTKPVHAYIDGVGASAALWAASQARHVTAGRTADVGSIGVRGTVIDSSRAAEGEGLIVYNVATGPHKGAGTPGTKVEPHHLAHFIEQAQDVHRQFKAALVRGRGLTADRVNAIADGRIFIGGKAKAAGLIDGVGSFEQALRRLQSHEYGQRPQPHSQERNAMANTGILSRLLKFGTANGLDTTALEGGEHEESAPDPRLAALDSAGIATPEQLQQRLQQAQETGALRTEAEAGRAALQELLEVHAVRRHGAAQGVKLAEDYAGHSFEQARKVCDEWKAQADGTYRQDALGGAVAQTQPPDPNRPAEAESAALSAERRAELEDKGRRTYENQHGRRLPAASGR